MPDGVSVSEVSGLVPIPGHPGTYLIVSGRGLGGYLKATLHSSRGELGITGCQYLHEEAGAGTGLLALATTLVNEEWGYRRGVEEETCARCQQPLDPLQCGEINGFRYCHGNADPSCYMEETWDRINAAPDA